MHSDFVQHAFEALLLHHHSGLVNNLNSHLSLFYIRLLRQLPRGNHLHDNLRRRIRELLVRVPHHYLLGFLQDFIRETDQYTTRFLSFRDFSFRVLRVYRVGVPWWSILLIFLIILVEKQVLADWEIIKLLFALWNPKEYIPKGTLAQLFAHIIDNIYRLFLYYICGECFLPSETVFITVGDEENIADYFGVLVFHSWWWSGSH